VERRWADVSATFLLPVYNGAATLAEAVDSILAQDDDDFELLLIDDASTDSSPAIARRYAHDDRRVRTVLHERNTGLAATLNEGLRLAGNELVLRMDQDDVSLPSRLRVQRSFMGTHPAVAVAGSWVFHMGEQPRFDRLVELPTTPRAVAAKLQQENCLYHPSVVMRRSTVLALGGYRAEFRNAEDYELWLRVSHEHDLANVAEPLLRYRFSVDGMTLGRKWEQLYYVHLAQTVHRNASLGLQEADVLARESLARVRRRSFMSQVARTTATELVALRHWGNAIEIAVRLGREIGVGASARLLVSIGRERARSWTS
jgi:glycosyltransferase involved in cell wall biosynthesis